MNYLEVQTLRSAMSKRAAIPEDPIGYAFSKIPDAWNKAKSGWNKATNWVDRNVTPENIGSTIGKGYKAVASIPGKARAFADDVDNAAGQFLHNNFAQPLLRGVFAARKEIPPGLQPDWMKKWRQPEQPANGPYTRADRSTADNLRVSAVENTRTDVPFSTWVERDKELDARRAPANGPYTPADRSAEDMKNVRRVQSREDWKRRYENFRNSSFGRGLDIYGYPRAHWNWVNDKLADRLGTYKAPSWMR